MPKQATPDKRSEIPGATTGTGPGKASKLMKPEEVAEYLGVSLSQAYKLMGSGRIPTLRIGRSLRTPLKVLEAWIENRTFVPDGAELSS